MARFLLITHISPPAIDGGSRVIHKIGEYLQKNGHQLMTLSSDASSTDDFTHRYSKLKNSGLPVYVIFHRILRHISKVLAKGPLFKIIPFTKFLFACIKYRPEYIIAGPLPTTAVLYANFFKKITGAKLIINASFHPTDPEFQQLLLTNTLKKADLIWTLTDHETNYFHKNFQIPFAKMIKLGNGIDQSLLARVPAYQHTRKPSLLFIGSFAAHKGLEVLFSALKFLPKGYTLTLAGKPTLYPLNIPKKVKVVHDFSDSQLSTLIDQSTILISPSTQESFGLVLLEAMARGIPVIAADIPASTELINNSKAGLLFRTNNPSDLASKINDIHGSKSLASRLSNNGHHYASTHTWDRIGESLWQKISSL